MAALSNDQNSFTRREMLSRLFQPLRKIGAVDPTKNHGASPAPKPAGTEDGVAGLAVIAGRDCLAYQGTGCSICHERCPVAGAIVLVQGLPRVMPDVCTGCRVCHEVCPAPTNAIRLVPRPPGFAKPVSASAPAPSPFPVWPREENK